MRDPKRKVSDKTAAKSRLVAALLVAPNHKMIRTEIVRIVFNNNVFGASLNELIDELKAQGLVTTYTRTVKVERREVTEYVELVATEEEVRKAGMAAQPRPRKRPAR